MKTASTLLLFLFVMCFGTAGAQGIYSNYGTSASGGPDNTGGILTASPDFSNVHGAAFLPVTIPGGGPTGDLVAYNGKLYGMTPFYGRNSNNGVLFECDPATRRYR